jgi:hypothetical protein
VAQGLAFYRVWDVMRIIVWVNLVTDVVLPEAEGRQRGCFRSAEPAPPAPDVDMCKQQTCMSVSI